MFQNSMNQETQQEKFKSERKITQGQEDIRVAYVRKPKKKSVYSGKSLNSLSGVKGMKEMKTFYPPHYDIKNSCMKVPRIQRFNEDYE